MVFAAAKASAGYRAMIGRLRAFGCWIVCVGVLAPRAATAQPAASLLDHLQLHASAALLDELSRQTVDEELAVRDTILGVPVEGRARVTGSTRLRLSPDAERAVFEVIFHGTAKSATTGRTPPVSIRSEAQTRFTLTKRFSLDDTGLKAQPASCRAETHSVVTSVDADWHGLRGWFVRRLASRRVESSHEEADEIAARHAERDLGRSFDRRCAALIEQANAMLASRWLRGGEGPAMRRLRFHTTADRLYAGMAPSSEQGGPATFDSMGDAAAVLAVPVQALSVAQSWQLLGAWLREGVVGLARELAGQPLSPEAVAWLTSSGGAGRRLSPAPSLADGWFRLTMQPAAPPSTNAAPLTVARRAP